MSGHSKWSTIKRKKGKEDAKRGVIFSRLSKAIVMAAKEGGGSPETNMKLANAIEKAKQANMPADNIQRAIKKGTGEIEGITYEEIIYEGYGAAGVAILVNVLTDNHRRAAAEIRHAFSKYNGNLGTSGSVAWIFESKGIILVAKDKATEDQLFDVALDYGVDDIRTEGDHFEIVCEPSDLKALSGALDSAGIEYESAESTMLPKNTVKLGKKEAGTVLRLMEALEEHEDVQEVYANFDIPDDVMEELAEAG